VIYTDHLVLFGWVSAWEHHVPLAFHLGREADHSPPSSAEVKECVELTSTPPIRLHGVVSR
jgi:hypothetical protein